MSQISFDELNNPVSSSSSNTRTVNFFTLKSGEEAIVRFMLDSPTDFTSNMLRVHPVTVNGKYRSVNCLRTPHDPVGNCPLCNNGVELKERFYIPMLQYVQENNVITPKPVIWPDRSMAMARELKEYFNNYGPLSNIICKITRKGDGLNTEWKIMPNLNPQIFDNKTYYKIDNAFDSYKVLGGLVIDRDFNAVKTFVDTGNFPVPSNNVNSETINDSVPEISSSIPSSNTSANNIGFNSNPMPWESAPSSVNRPVRTF